jgi:hypothetical protein
MKNNTIKHILIILIIILVITLLYIILDNKYVENLQNDIKIPKIIMQTHKTNINECVKNKLLSHAPNWNYEFYNDDQILNFFIENPLSVFPNIKDKFNSMPTGAHKADLFRYYYLYIKGGVFIDSDAMLDCDDLTLIIPSDCEFFSCDSNAFPETIFQGFIGCTPKNKIIYEALKHAYSVDIIELQKEYHYLIRELYKIVNNNKSDKIYLFMEEPDKDNLGYSTVYDKNKLVLTHYYAKKDIDC